ncbi:ABC transporter permease [Psychroserpens luteolus]|uniref:ABC transporter permease n=1 Tax=Psychroserpens luteolus TaxID=2855840 RepID=UPI001E45DDB2|nr:ABC transporter permease [Psychroserpens luteolus]MCD2258667.1 ABC transporter permease [Psychroserpens luteolus]
MFNIERWQEIFETLSKNKLRTFLTGLSVASGIFILVILLGFGEGMANGIKKEFEDDASNRIHVWTEVTSKEYKGLNPGRYIQMENENYEYLAKKYEDDLEYKSAIYRIWQGAVNYKTESGSYRIEGVLPDFQFIENAGITQGRFVNYMDQDGFEKVVVIGNKVKQEIFKNEEDPIDQQIQINGINFKVIGVYTDPGGDREESRIFTPISTAQRVFNGANRIRNLSFTLKPKATFDETLEASEQFVEEMQQYLKQVHTIAPDDMSAIGTFNTLEASQRYFGLIGNIKFFFWFVGICTIIAGVVGVSNIMLIIVKERTREIGIRKAIGAQPWSIIGMILHEAIFVTAIAGFTGLIVSMGLLEIFGPYLEIPYVINPSVNFNVALSTVIILILAGAIAGFFPAWRAVKIKPIEALRDE